MTLFLKAYYRWVAARKFLKEDETGDCVCPGHTLAWCERLDSWNCYVRIRDHKASPAELAQLEVKINSGLALHNPIPMH